MSIRRSLAALVLLSALFPTAAHAQSDADKATARELYTQGLSVLEKKDFAAAADLFKRADSLFHAPTITLGLARAYAGLGKLMSAQEAYSSVAHETVPANASAAFVNAVKEARQELEALSPRVPGVVINVKGTAAAKVTLDGADVPSAALGVKRPVNPGKHIVKVTAPGFFAAEATVTVAEGKSEPVNVELKVDPNYKAPATPPPGPGQPGVVAPPADEGPAPSPLRKTLGFVGLGVGGAGLIVGAITGGLALSKRSALLEACPDGSCPKNSEAKHQAAVDSYNSMGTISTIGFIAGGALAATGVILVVTAPKARTTGMLMPVIGPGYFGAQGRF